jgi:hypothetical protein
VRVTVRVQVRVRVRVRVTVRVRVRVIVWFKNESDSVVQKFTTRGKNSLHVVLRCHSSVCDQQPGQQGSRAASVCRAACIGWRIFTAWSGVQPTEQGRSVKRADALQVLECFL